MARALPEWIGKTDDQRAPPRIRDRIHDRHPNCHICGLLAASGKKVALDHVIALINGGENRESNLRPIHVKCHAEKTKQDVAEKARINSIRQKHRRIVDAPKMQGQPFATTQKAASRQPKASLPVRLLYEAPPCLWPVSTDPQHRESSE